jgi:APA family basic amino acid/polyamine antiporter
VTRTPNGASSVSTAVVLGLGAVLGAGMFIGLAPAAAAAGRWFLPALLISAVAALCCAFSTADQSRAHPDAGGGYEYIRNQLGPWSARIGGSAHLLSRAAVAAALAATFADYVFPEHRPAAALGLLVVTAVIGAAGVRWSTRLSWTLAGVVLVALVLVVVVCFSVAPPAVAPTVAGAPGADDAGGIMGAAGLMFVAFSGFERITAPLRGDPACSARRLRTAIPVLVALVLVVHLAVGAAVVHQLGTARLALSPAPLRDAMIAADARFLAPVVQVGAAVAAVSALFFVFAGSRRTLAAMAEAGDLPVSLAGAPDAPPPWPLDLIGGAAAVIAVLLLTPAQALAVGACGALFYYAFTNASARILLQKDRTWPMRTACLGLGLSVLLAMSLPVGAMLITVVAMAVGTGLTGLCAHVSAQRREAVTRAHSAIDLERS